MAKKSAPGRQTLTFGVDRQEVAMLDGFATSLEASIKTDRHIGPLLKQVHHVMSEDFNTYMDTVARATADGEMDSPFHHVYEWGLQGVPQGRLWNNRLEGHGANRWATFTWRASKRTAPVPDDSLGPNVAQGKKFRKIHVFVWKAMVMEYQSRVRIESKASHGWLAWASNGPNSIKGLEFSRGPIYINPGGGNTVGKFTTAFGEWWTGDGADHTFDKKIRQVLEKDFKRKAEEQLARGTRVTSKTMSVTAMKAGRGNSDAFNRGKRAADKMLAEQRRNYYGLGRFGRGEEEDE